MLDPDPVERPSANALVLTVAQWDRMHREISRISLESENADKGKDLIPSTVEACSKLLGVRAYGYSDKTIL